MKRKFNLVEKIDSSGHHNNKEVFFSETDTEYKMYKNTIWYNLLMNAEKTCLKDEQIKKIHYKFDDGKEMVEEYNVDTKVLLRRAWKMKGKLGGEGKWSVELGDPIPETTPNADSIAIIESKDQPVLLKRNTRVNIEWRIRNLPYPIETYSIKAQNGDKSIIISTSNKKYYKKLEVPELARLGLPIEQMNIDATHKYNTLIITYKKPQELLNMDKEWFEELNKIKPIKDIPNECKTQ
ncbi:protein DPCD isoform X2 [Nymphalis io]|nr:protein DPCD isoform X2 [Nymphalis io]